jgi:hypothetical protein
MPDEILRGSYFGLIVCGLSLFCLFSRLVPTYYFAVILAGWVLYSLYRVFALFVKQSRALPGGRSRRDALAYWLGAIGSSVLAVLLWMLVVSQIKIF